MLEPVQSGGNLPTKQKRSSKPSWIRSRIPTGANFKTIQKELKNRGLHTVCQAANCPNLGECWEASTATIMILGDICTRTCRFCATKSQNPNGYIDPNEITHAIEMAQIMGLKYLVITSVTRDDLADFGAGHFANLVSAIYKNFSSILVEVLVPDFGAKSDFMHTLAQSNPYVIAHNLETVRRLTPHVRDRRASYDLSLAALRFYKDNYAHIATKSSIMVGLGETQEEIEETFDDLIEQKVNIVTIGQYLRPTLTHLPVEKFYTPDEFEKLKKIALEKGFEFVAAGPMVRSSYKAADYCKYIKKKRSEIS